MFEGKKKIHFDNVETNSLELLALLNGIGIKDEK